MSARTVPPGTSPGLFLMILTILGGSLSLAAAPEPVKIQARLDVTAWEYHLDNGLTVVLLPNPKAPLVSVQHWVRAGSLCDTPGFSGTAHFFEHMMFRAFREGDVGFDPSLQALGGSCNAMTQFACTNFLSTVPPENLELLLRLESDRFQNMVVDEDAMFAEKGVVLSELNMDASMPIMDLITTLYRQAFPGHGYANFIGGNKAEVEKLTVDDCNSFFRKYYRPGNMGLFIAGDISPDQVLAWVEHYYGSWPRGEVGPPPKAYQHPGGPVSVQGQLPSDMPTYILGFRSPEYNGTNHHLLDLVYYLMFNSSNNLTRKLLKDQGLVLQSGGLGKNMGAMLCFALPAPGVTSSTLVEQMLTLPDVVAGLTEEEWQAYLREYRISTAEGLLRNEEMNSALGESWARKGSIRAVVQTANTDLPVTRQQVVDFMRNYCTRNHLLVAESLFTPPAEGAETSPEEAPADVPVAVEDVPQEDRVAGTAQP